MKQYRLNINNVTYVRIDCEHIMVFRISISYIIINQNIMRHDAINHSLGEIDTFINHFAIRFYDIADHAQYTYTHSGKHVQNKKISSRLKIVCTNDFTNFQIDKSIKLESFLVHFPLSTFVYYTIRPSFEPPYHCIHRFKSESKYRSKERERKRAVEIERWWRMERLSIPITNPSDASSDPETIGTFSRPLPYRLAITFR